MNLRENTMAILNYWPYDKMPVVAFGYWGETVDKWVGEGHITRDEAEGYRHGGDNGEGDKAIMRRLGFDYSWASAVGAHTLLLPHFQEEVLEERPDGSKIISDSAGLICMVKPGTASIPAEIGTRLTGRKAWEELYLPRLRMAPERVDVERLKALPPPKARDIPLGLHVGSLIGQMRNMLGVEHLSYLWADDEELYIEIIDTLCGLCYECADAILGTGVQFDFAHYWEDICFKNGPLVSPVMFEEYIGPWYKKINDRINAAGTHIISLDCDGCIDALVPIWLKNGVNTMFPIEVGTWRASIAPWRRQYGKALRGVGGMDKNVFARDKAAVDEEVERLKILIALGGFIPCVDHRIAPDAEFALVQRYCDKMQNIGVI